MYVKYSPETRFRSFVENEYARLWIQNRILFFEYKSGVQITLEVARKVVADRVALQNGRAFPILCDISGVLGSEKAARDYLSLSGSVLTRAISFLVAPTVPLAILRFYLEKNKPPIPTAHFSDKAQAIKFLEPYL